MRNGTLIDVKISNTIPSDEGNVNHFILFFFLLCENCCCKLFRKVGWNVINLSLSEELIKKIWRKKLQVRCFRTLKSSNGSSSTRDEVKISFIKKILSLQLCQSCDDLIRSLFFSFGYSWVTLKVLIKLMLKIDTFGRFK